ncbi:MAG: YigZ family protein [Lachnospiraceae bacterium]|nr:YigZ family protein [Lachnospiraceae bacterium]
MKNGYKTILRAGQGEIIEKKSRFIATVRPIESEQEAILFISEMKKKYWDAKHNCSAFIIGSNSEITRCSDDGEPSGTAGKPMLEVLLGHEITNCAVVVTRYFGGTLLGTGGLVRAYTQAVQAGINDSTVIEKKHGVKMSFTTDYNGVRKVQYLLMNEGYPILNSEYTDIVVIDSLVPIEDSLNFQNKMTEGTNGKCKILLKNKIYYTEINGEVLLFDE